MPAIALDPAKFAADDNEHDPDIAWEALDAEAQARPEQPAKKPVTRKAARKPRKKTEDAPYGYKADGTPRKRPVPQAAIQAQREARKRKQAPTTPQLIADLREYEQRQTRELEAVRAALRALEGRA